MAKASSGFVCGECGWQTAKWTGRCGECQQWGTLKERAKPKAALAKTTKGVAPSSGRDARPITELGAVTAEHRPTGIHELDRVFGGGIVPGAAILLSGEPGVGKSTLLLEVAARAAAAGGRVLYVSGEESTGQIRMRAERTGAMHDTLFLASENDLSTVLGQIDAVTPTLVIVDSVQTIASDQVEGGAGGPAQVREVAAALTRVAKEVGTPVILVGHVTKDGSVAGPRLLEHLVDVVCHFEGDRHSRLRFLRSLKNRFGPTDEVGCFEMASHGITEVPDPSGLFLSTSTQPVAGTCAMIALEGRRALPVEVQALVIDASSPNPRRVVSGLDSSRVAMILAILTQHADMNLQASEVYVSTVGGVRVNEPAADLAIALAVMSAETGVPVPKNMVAVGEISLAGEIRPPLAADARAKEALRLGYDQLLGSRLGYIGDAKHAVLGAET